MLVVVRHADAGNKRMWAGPDELRPLTETGRSRADALCHQLATLPVRQVIASPTLRCEQTVAPLAHLLALPLIREPLLLPGTPLPALLEFLTSARAHDAVLCTHREVLEPLLDQWRNDGSVAVSTTERTAKGAYWVIDGFPGPLSRATHHPAAAAPS